VNGVATFSGLSLNKAGAYTLTISSDDSTPYVTGPIIVATAPPVVSSTAIITSEHALFAGKGKHKHLVGFQLTFKSTVAASVARSADDYTVTQTINRRGATIAQAIPVRVRYNAASHTAKLLLAGTPRFTNGGQLVVRLSPHSTSTGSTGDDAIFSIPPNGQGIAS
jgi:hypothetical protein